MRGTPLLLSAFGLLGAAVADDALHWEHRTMTEPQNLCGDTTYMPVPPTSWDEWPWKDDCMAMQKHIASVSNNQTVVWGWNSTDATGEQRPLQQIFSHATCAMGVAPLGDVVNKTEAGDYAITVGNQDLMNIALDTLQKQYPTHGHVSVEGFMDCGPEGATQKVAWRIYTVQHFPYRNTSTPATRMSPQATP
ncbi:hypothetical protein F4780DRAFT_733778 [Xylariomycetidae sp. FL0641]|nr:hypothetical protein F4780DRAFT_733778 [Xylariomycetidae sp. FL0641]